MMKKIKFTKMVASGNDFVVVDSFPRLSVEPLRKIAKNICDRKYGAGADGLLVLEKSKKANVKMRIFNADGSEAEMCGNGARCTALYAICYMLYAKHKITIETKAGIIESEVKKDNVKIKLTDPKDIKLDMPVKVNNRFLKVNFINTGVPHAVIFVEGLDKIDVANLGKRIRFHQRFAPAGTNVDFVEVLNKDSIEVRTYERGVEDETLACGTGSVASALIFALKTGRKDEVAVKTQSGEILEVSFKRSGDLFFDTWLKGKVRIVYKGDYHV